MLLPSSAHCFIHSYSKRIIHFITRRVKWRGWSKNFLGLEIFDSGIFWLGKFCMYFFGWLDFRRDFLGIQNNLTIRGSVRVSRPRTSANNVQPNLFCFLETFKARKFDMGFFGELTFGPGNFWGFDFCLHSIIPVTWNLEYPPWVLHRHCSSTYYFTHKSGSTCVAGRNVFAQSSERRMHRFQNVFSPSTASKLLYQNFARANDPAAGYAGYVPCE